MASLTKWWLLEAYFATQAYSAYILHSGKFGKVHIFPQGLQNKFSYSYFRMCACGNATPTSLASTRVFDMITISNVKLFVDFIFVRRRIIRNIRKFAPIQNLPLYGRHNIYMRVREPINSNGRGIGRSGRGLHFHHSINRDSHFPEGQPPGFHHLHQTAIPQSRNRPVAGKCLPLAAPPANTFPHSGRFSLGSGFSVLL